MRLWVWLRRESMSLRRVDARTGTLCGDHVRGDRLRDGRATSGDITRTFGFPPHLSLHRNRLPHLSQWLRQ